MKTVERFGQRLRKRAEIVGAVDQNRDAPSPLDAEPGFFGRRRANARTTKMAPTEGLFTTRGLQTPRGLPHFELLSACWIGFQPYLGGD